MREQTHIIPFVRTRETTLAIRHADTDQRDQALDRLLGFYLTTADAADDHLRALPGTPVPGEFTGWEDTLIRVREPNHLTTLKHGSRLRVSSGLSL
jgi:hypothetical protein